MCKKQTAWTAGCIQPRAENIKLSDKASETRTGRMITILRSCLEELREPCIHAIGLAIARHVNSFIHPGCLEQ